jgi:spore coat-associated protein N
MSLKKKLGLGAASAALGLSLIGGGTFAFFNDTMTINHSYAAGTLDLQVNKVQGEAINFDLSNLKPGDTMTRRFYLKNNGSVAIKDVLLDAKALIGDFKDGAGAPADQTQLDNFLKQFKIDVLRTQNGYSGNANSIIASGQTLTLYDLVNEVGLDWKLLPGHKVGERVNIASPVGSNGEGGLPADPRDTDIVIFNVTFVDDGTNQNQYQGDSAKFSFDLEARQWGGATITENDPNGKINNGKQSDALQPNPITETGSTVTDLVDPVDNPEE